MTQPAFSDRVSERNVSSPVVPVPPSPAAGGDCYDIRGSGISFPGPLLDPNDIAPAVEAAILAAKAAGGGTVCIPSRGGNVAWVWRSSPNIDLANFPCDVDVVGFASVIRIENADVTDNSLFIGNAIGMIRFRGLIFTGDPARTNDCASVIRCSGCNMVQLDDCQFWGLQSSTNTLAILALDNNRTIDLKDLFFAGCGFFGATGGVINVSSHSICLLKNVRFVDFDSFGGQGYNKSGGKCWVYCDNQTGSPFPTENDSGFLGFDGCFFDEGVTRNVWINAALQLHFDKASFRGCWFNVPNPGAFDAAITFAAGRYLTVEDSVFLLASSPNARAVNVSNCGTLSFIRTSFRAGVHTVLFGVGNTSVSFVDSEGYKLDCRLAAPLIASETYGGLTTFYPISVPGCKLWLRADMNVTLNGANIVGAGATYAAVVAGHHLDLVLNGAPLVINFTGAENSQVTFLATLNAALGPVGASAINSGGQIEIIAPVSGNVSSGSIAGTSSADVLASLGLAAGPFNTATCTSWEDNSGVADVTHNVAEAVNPPAYTLANASFNNLPTTGYAGFQQLKSALWTAALAQPLCVFIIAKQTVAGAVDYLFDSFSDPPQCALFGVAAFNSVHEFAGVNAAFAVGNTNVEQIYQAAFNGAASNLSASSDTPIAAANAGANGLNGTTIGNYAGGLALAGWEIAEVAIFDHVPTLQERAKLNAYASRRYGISLV